MTLPLSCNSNTPRAQSLTRTHGTLCSPLSVTQRTPHYVCYKTRPCGTICITCTTVGVPSLCMELHTRHTPLRTSSPEPCVVTNTTAKHQSHRTIALCGNIPHYINLVGRELQQLLGGGSAVSHVSRAMTNIFHAPTTRMKEPQFHVLTIQSIIREGYGKLQFVNLHSDHTTPTTQRTSYHT